MKPRHNSTFTQQTVQSSDNSTSLSTVSQNVVVVDSFLTACNNYNNNGNNNIRCSPQSLPPRSLQTQEPKQVTEQPLVSKRSVQWDYTQHNITKLATEQLPLTHTVAVWLGLLSHSHARLRQNRTSGDNRDRFLKGGINNQQLTPVLPVSAVND